MNIKLKRALPSDELAFIGAGLIALAIALYNLIQFYQPSKGLGNLVLLAVFGVVSVSFLYAGLKPSAMHIYRVMKDQYGSTLWFKLLRLILIAVIGVIGFIIEVVLSILINGKGQSTNSSSSYGQSHAITRGSSTTPNPYINPDWKNHEEVEAFLNSEEMPASAYAPKHYK